MGKRCLTVIFHLGKNSSNVQSHCCPRFCIFIALYHVVIPPKPRLMHLGYLDHSHLTVDIFIGDTAEPFNKPLLMTMAGKMELSDAMYGNAEKNFKPLNLEKTRNLNWDDNFPSKRIIGRSEAPERCSEAALACTRRPSCQFSHKLPVLISSQSSTDI
uniref:C3H1-type domain-containing protein n=1 Tax=Romanomermis culicivorax TaxID=13658 RepID=A0A915KD12_ROMCU